MIHVVGHFPEVTLHRFEPTHVTLATGDYRYPIGANAFDIDAAMGAFAHDLKRVAFIRSSGIAICLRESVTMLGRRSLVVKLMSW